MRVLSSHLACFTFCQSIRLDLRFVLLSGVSLCVFPLALSAQSVTFIGPVPSVNFGNVNLCQTAAATPAPCSETLTLSYKVTAGGMLGTPQVVTQGSPNLDFTLAAGSTCIGVVSAGSTCIINVKFAPLFAGSRSGGVLVTNENGKVLTKTFVRGYAVGPQIGFNPGNQIDPPFGQVLNDAISYSMAADGAGDLFVAGSEPWPLLELPAGGGPAIKVSAPARYQPYVLTIDGAGDIFYLDGADYGFVEIPVGGGPFIEMPYPGAYYGETPPVAITADASGNIFVLETETYYSDVVSYLFELPATGGPVLQLPLNGMTNLVGLAVDSNDNVFVSDNSSVYKLAGSAAPVTLPIASDYFSALLVDNVGNLLDGILELPVGANTAIKQPVAPGAVDSAGDIFQFSEFYPVIEFQRSRPPLLNFGNIAVGTTTNLHSLMITNTGTGKLTVEPSFNESSYRILSTEPGDCLAGITPGANCTVLIEFAPTAIGAHNGLLTLTTNGVTNPAVTLQGSASGANAPVLSLQSGVYATAQTVSISDTTAGAIIHYTTNGSTPTGASPVYTTPLAVTSTERVSAVAIGTDAPSKIVTAVYSIATSKPINVINFGQGFSESDVDISLLETGSNGASTTIEGTSLLLTTTAFYPKNSSGAAYAYYLQNIQSFTTFFTFQLSPSLGATPLSEIADGMTFTIQNTSPGPIGGAGAGLGYSGIGKSVAIKFDLHDDAGEGPSSTGLYINGAEPTVPSVNLNGTGLDLHSGDVFLAEITYDGTNLVLTLTDTATFLSYTHSFAVDIPAIVGGNAAVLGFTASTGNETAKQAILNWTYVSGPPGPPAPPPPAAPALPEFQGGFNAVGLTVNGSASIAGSALKLTSGSPNDAGSAFYSTPLNIQRFTSDFTFQLTNPVADGFTFTIQNGGAKALGGIGGYLGYGGISKSVAIKFDLFSNDGEGPDSTGTYSDGTAPTTPAIDLTGTGIDLHSGDVFAAHVTYDGTNLVLTLTDTLTGASWSHTHAIDIPGTVGSDTALVGFTGATGGLTSTQQILNWTFTNP